MMKHLVIFFMVLLIFGVFISTGQELDEANAPQKVKSLLQELRADIKDEGLSFKVGYNPALNFSIDDLCGLVETKDWMEKAKSLSISVKKPGVLRSMAAVGLPANWDWRDHNGVTPIRNQGSCGSCWAFGTIGTVESLLLIRDSLNTDLSEQHLVSCNTKGWGCDGGWWPHDMLVNPGAVLESEFPYVASDVACGGPYSYPYQINGWAYVDGSNQVPAVDKIKEAIQTYGPLCAAVYVGTYFQSYTGGIFDKNESSNNGICGCGQPSKVNHAIILIGWDDSKQAWLLRNSWGPGWGESGYMWIKYGTSQVGYAAVIAY